MPGQYNLQDIRKVSSDLSQVFLFVESVNAIYAARLIDSGVSPFTVQDVILNLRKRLLKDFRWPSGRVEAVDLFEEADVLPEMDQETIDQTALLLLRPARPRPVRSDGKVQEWSLDGQANLPVPRPADSLKIDGYIASSSLGREIFSKGGRFRGLQKLDTDDCGFSTTQVTSQGSDRFRKIPLFLWDQVLDPMAAAQNFLLSQIKSRNVVTADFAIQRWLKHEFDIDYTNDTKYRILGVCRHLNGVFFQHEQPSHKITRQVHSATLSSVFLVEKIFSSYFSVRGSELKKSLGDHRQLRVALGIFLFLRFCQILRIRYSWLDEPAFEKQPTSKAHGEKVRRAVHLRQCSSAFRSLEYMFLQKRIFGSLSEIPGLNYIFGGGILPRTSSGRTCLISGPPGSGKTLFALQTLVSVAAHGGLAVYFSFEETRELISDRLATFGLVDFGRFDVREAGADIEDVIKDHVRRADNRGLLLLFGLEEGERFSLVEYLRRIREAAGESLPWRSLALDSVNALEFVPSALHSEEADGPGTSHRPQTVASRGSRSASEAVGRESLRLMVDSIEQMGFLGILIGEEGIPGFFVLPYLADTVVKMYVDESRLGRRLEITKCRSQDFHLGPHAYSISEGKGIKIYPSLSAIRKGLRRKPKSSLSEEKQIEFPPGVEVLIGESGEGSGHCPGLRLKSTSLIYGPSNSGKTLLAVDLATEGSTYLKGGKEGRSSGMLFVSFKTAETQLKQLLRNRRGYEQKWQEVRRTAKLRWYSPGENITGAQIIGEIWDTVLRSRREGAPIGRLVLDEIECVEAKLPYVRREPLFWSTLLELIGSEAMTAFFVYDSQASHTDKYSFFHSEADYVLNVRRSEGEQRIRLDKFPRLEERKAGVQAGGKAPAEGGDEAPAEEN
jgi:KaiC/GvpD/RAD55 family RecA-like ATPase